MASGGGASDIKIELAQQSGECDPRVVPDTDLRLRLHLPMRVCEDETASGRERQADLLGDVEGAASQREQTEVMRL
jgi:hypothetical protein